MLTAVLSLAGALVYGAADFLGGLAAKRLNAMLVTAVAGLTGLALLAVVLPFAGGEWRAADVAFGALSGVTNAIGVALLYACLAIGPMSILSPLTAVVSAIVPMAWGLATGERLGALAPWGLGLALVAVVLVGFVPERGAVRPTARALAMGVGAGLGIGGFYILMDQTADASGLVPLAANRAVTAIVLFAAFAVIMLVGRGRRAAPAAPPHPEPPVATQRRPAASPAGTSSDSGFRRGPIASGLAIAVSCGLLDVTANALLLFGIRAGDVSIAAVLGAMYPAGTILLAAIVLRERIAPVQWTGLALALTAAALLALA